MTQPLPHFLSPTSLSLDATQELFERALDLKKRPIRTVLAGQSAGLVFFNALTVLVHKAQIGQGSGMLLIRREPVPPHTL